MNVHFLIRPSILAAGMVAGCAQQGATAPSPSPQNVYDYCMPIESKAVAARFVAEKKDLDPNVVAHIKCTFYARVCAQDPQGETCTSSLARLSKLKADQ